MAGRRIFQHGHHADRALALPRPRWRGRSHQIALALSLPAGTWLVARAEPGTPRLAAALFAAGMVAMFAASVAFHWRRWDDHHTAEVMLRLDHTGIYAAIAGTASAFALVGLEHPARTIALAALGVAVVVGLVVEWLPFANPRGLNNAIFLVIGWGSVVVVPLLWQRLGVAPVLLLLGGGVLYSAGVLVVGLQRPDPNPEVFGYHEIWHLFVIGAVALHFVDIALLTA